MGLAWQQGPLATGSVGHFLTERPLPPRLLFAEPLRRRMRVSFADRWIADSDDVILLHEPGRYPVAYFARGDIEPGILIAEDRVTAHHDLGETRWFTVKVPERPEREANHGAWQHTGLPQHAAILDGRLAFAWRAMDAGMCRAKISTKRNSNQLRHKHSARTKAWPPTTMPAAISARPGPTSTPGRRSIG